MLTQKSVVLAFIIATGAAQAQDDVRPDVVRGLCQKDGCAEFVITEKTPVSTGSDGQLFRTRITLYHASARGRTSQGEENGYVYCSTTRPAILSAPDKGGPTAFLLAPDDRSPAYAQRSSTNFYTIYFALCHGLEAGRSAARDRQGTARSLGYKVARQSSANIPLKRIDDILKP